MTGDQEGPRDETEGDDGRPFESGFAEREAHYPDEGYNVVEINLMRPPGEALTLRYHTMKLSAIRLPPATEFEDFVIYDQSGHAYDHEDLHDDPSGEGSLEVEELMETIQREEGREKRLALFAIAKRAEDNPTDTLEAVPILTPQLETAEPAEQAETLAILAHIAREYPEEVAPAVDDVMGFLTPETAEEPLTDATTIVAALAESNPGAVVDAVPKLAALLQDGSFADTTAVTALQRIAKPYPDAVVPLSPQIIHYLEGSDDGHRIGALGILGMLSKDYPHVAEDTIPTAIELLDADDYKLRANSAGLLADLAQEYPHRVEPAVPQVIELLADSDEKARYNATSILARVAEADPGAVEEAIEPLIDMVEDDFPFSRSNACWALGYLEAEEALEQLEDVKETDPDEKVRDAAAFAVHQIKSR